LIEASHVYLIHKDSQRSLDYLSGYFASVHALIEDAAGDAKNAYFGARLDRPPRKWSAAEIDAAFNPAIAIAAFDTQELAVEPHALARTFREAIAGLATTDPLTGLNNRRGFFEKADAALREAEQSGSLSAILIDIDSFKAVNDLFGHHTGDEAIRAIAVEAQHDHAIVGRLGGDEFSILLRQPFAEALSLAESLRRRFEAVRLKTADGELSLTCSLGISELEANDTIDGLIGRADMALYRAKEEGRNRVATPPSPAWIEQHPRRTGTIARTTAR
jgi:diguanylate cyclase (GGDEF)-like protein